MPQICHLGMQVHNREMGVAFAGADPSITHQVLHSSDVGSDTQGRIAKICLSTCGPDRSVIREVPARRT